MKKIVTFIAIFLFSSIPIVGCISEPQHAEKTKVTDVLFGYVMEPSADGEGILQPVYIFEGNDQIGNSKEAFEPVIIDAREEVTLT